MSNIQYVIDRMKEIDISNMTKGESEFVGGIVLLIILLLLLLLGVILSKSSKKRVLRKIEAKYE